MKTLKIFLTIVLISFLAVSAQAKFYYNFGLNLGLGYLGWSNVEPTPIVTTVVPYAPVVATPVYTPPPCSYVSYYDYGNCWWWPNISLSFSGCGGSVCGYSSYYSSCYTPCYYSPVSFSFGFNWGNCLPSYGTYCGYYGWRGCGYYGYPWYDCYDNYEVNNYYYNSPPTAQRPKTVKENYLPAENGRTPRESVASSFSNNGRAVRNEIVSGEARTTRTEKRAPNGSERTQRVAKNNSERTSGFTRSLRSEIFNSKNDYTKSRISYNRANRGETFRTAKLRDESSRRISSARRISTSRTSSRSRVSTPRISRPSSSFRPGTSKKVSRPRVSAPRVSRPRVSAPRMSRPSISRAPAIRMPSTTMPRQSGGGRRMRR